ncbi:hypothetical protein E2C01_010046 [Portunus trituberculatus]|uniref:Uncharacterized protein n=1 Tax=Portunus trituberculatus TaxID=210409 RepID=A0A5B7D7C0_PORTR|nr:hypothetical protein [Portunus trituberculatus]
MSLCTRACLRRRCSSDPASAFCRETRYSLGMPVYFFVEEYEASCRKKFELDNAIYKKIFTFLESRSFFNDEEKPERKFIQRKATTFQWDASLSCSSVHAWVAYALPDPLGVRTRFTQHTEHA